MRNMMERLRLRWTVSDVTATPWEDCISVLNSHVGRTLGYLEYGRSWCVRMIPWIHRQMVCGSHILRESSSVWSTNSGIDYHHGPPLRLLWFKEEMIFWPLITIDPRLSNIGLLPPPLTTTLGLRKWSSKTYRANGLVQRQILGGCS